ncbi:MAG: peptidase [Massilia sp.]|jgi:murein DD-endopeptidase MepM/ murein hydrolase activator NlpD|nr:peptidase [Massilia sp.]
MMPAELLSLQLMRASLGCVVASLAAWALLSMACRRWPALALSRRACLLAQLLTVAAFLFVLAPQSARFSVMPAIELAPAPQQAAQLDAVAASFDAAPVAENASGDWLVRAAQAWLAVYLAGVVVSVVRLVLAQRALQGLIRGATRLTDLRQHDGFGAVATPAVDVYETDLAVSPMLIGVWRPVLLLPRHLRDFDVLQQQMIIAHELTHLRRNDPKWMAASIATQTALWFNPVMRELAERLTWAQELSCDQQVLAGRPQPQRQAYAAALVGQLKLQRHAFGPALAFGGFSATSLTARMLLIRQGGAKALGSLRRCAVVAGFGAVFAASLALQPAFAWRIAQAQSQPVPAVIEWHAPLEHARVSSFFGVVSPLRPRGHRGIDFMAKPGTPVLASADGAVVSSSDLDAGGAKYGKTIIVAHANGFNSVYAHLGRRLVAEGDIVKAGQQIGLSGATGKVTGPHLHFEVRRGGETVNPETMLAGLAVNATPRALRNRVTPTTP